MTKIYIIFLLFINISIIYLVYLIHVVPENFNDNISEKNINNVEDITTIITTSCRKNTPDTSILLENVKCLHEFVPLLAKNIIIVFDGYEIKEKSLHSKCKNECNDDKYKLYIKNIKISLSKLYPDTNINYIIMPERSCLSTSLKVGINASKTNFINIMQEDLIIQKSFDVSAIINSIKNNNNIDIIRYSHGLNSYHQHYWKFCEGSIKEKTIKMNNLILSKSNNYSDNNHISSKEFYNKYVFSNINEYDFMEHQIGCEVGKKLPNTIWYLDKYNEGEYLNNKDGRNS